MYGMQMNGMGNLGYGGMGMGGMGGMNGELNFSLHQLLKNQNHRKHLRYYVRCLRAKTRGFEAACPRTKAVLQQVWEAWASVAVVAVVVVIMARRTVAEEVAGISALTSEWSRASSSLEASILIQRARLCWSTSRSGERSLPLMLQVLVRRVPLQGRRQACVSANLCASRPTLLVKGQRSSCDHAQNRLER